MPSNPLRIRALLLLVAAATLLLWVFAFPASKAVSPNFTAEQIVLLRYLVACLFYLALFAAGRFALPRAWNMPAKTYT